MSNQGYISLHRKIMQNSLYPFKSKRKFSRYEAWIDLLMLVEYEDKVKDNYSFLAGETDHALSFFAKRWRWSKTTVYDFFCYLEKQKMLYKREVLFNNNKGMETRTETRTTSRTETRTVYGVTNYKQYQGLQEIDDEETRTETRTTSRTETRTNLINNNKRRRRTTTKNDIIYKQISHLVLTEKEAKKLIAKYSQKMLDEILDEIEDYQFSERFKSYKSLAQVAANWLRRRKAENDATDAAAEQERLKAEAAKKAAEDDIIAMWQNE